MSVEKNINVLTELIRTVSKDRRDEWPNISSHYVKGEILSLGYFGAVRFAECRDPVFGFDGLEIRHCVIKTIYLHRRFENIFEQLDGEYSMISTLSLNLNETALPVKDKLFRFYRRIVLELYILNRCRHENIMHSHSVFFDTDLHIVYPRCYVLQQLINMYRLRKNSDPIPVKIIAKIIRQLCYALEYLSKIGIIHRDVQPENIFLTRGGTIKLAHFGQSSVLFLDSNKTVCKTPVGKKEFMCYEKLFNVYQGKSIDDCLQYSYSADIWSLGVLVLTMITYFPNEKGHKLDNDFALFMQSEKMPFVWLTSEMLQLRSRIVKSGGEELKTFLSDYLLTVSTEKRATAFSLPKTLQMKKWCFPNIDEDKVYLRKYFINEVDFANRFKLEDSAPNYNCLETKDIPAEFYWNEKWKNLESSSFLVKINYPTNNNNNFSFDKSNCQANIVSNTLHNVSKYCFKFCEPEPLFRFLYTEFLKGQLKLTDLILLDYEIKELIYILIEKTTFNQNTQYSTSSLLTKRIHLLPKSNMNCEVNHEFVDIEIEFAPKNCHQMFFSLSDSSENSDFE